MLVQISNSGSAFLPHLPSSGQFNGAIPGIMGLWPSAICLCWICSGIAAGLQVHQVNDGSIGNYIGKYLRMLYLINDKAYRAVELGCSSPGSGKEFAQGFEPWRERIYWNWIRARVGERCRFFLNSGNTTFYFLVKIMFELIWEDFFSEIKKKLIYIVQIVFLFFNPSTHQPCNKQNRTILFVVGSVKRKMCSIH